MRLANSRYISIDPELIAISPTVQASTFGKGNFCPIVLKYAAISREEGNFEVSSNFEIFDQNKRRMDEQNSEHGYGLSSKRKKMNGLNSMTRAEAEAKQAQELVPQRFVP